MKNHTKKHQKEYRQFLAVKRPDVFKRLLLTHQNGSITRSKRFGKVSRDNTDSKGVDTGGRSSEE